MILGKLGKPSTLSMYAKLVWLVCASAADNSAGHSVDFFSTATFKKTSDSAALLKALTRKNKNPQHGAQQGVQLDVCVQGITHLRST